MAGQIVSVEQFRYHDWDAGEWLLDVGSPRLDDVPRLGDWCNRYGQANDIDPRIALTMLEKEQSFVTLQRLSAHRHDWAMGFGVYPDGTHLYKWRGENNVGPEMQIKHALMRLRELADGAQPNLTPDMGFELENGPTRALYVYNPSVAGNKNFWSIFHRWFGDGGGSGLEARPTTPPIEATREDVAEVAREATAAHRAGDRQITIEGVWFDLVATGWCARFVRQCHLAAVRQYDPSFPTCGFGWVAPDAWEMEINLRDQGYEIESGRALPGDIAALNVGLTPASHGHIGIDLGDTIAENTSRDNLGTVETPKRELAHRISGHYAVLQSAVPHVAVVYPSDIAHAEIVDCGAYIGGDGRMYAQVDPLTAAYGKHGHYKQSRQGGRMVHRYYVKD